MSTKTSQPDSSSISGSSSAPLVYNNTMTEPMPGTQAVSNRSKVRSVGIVAVCILAMVVGSGNITAVNIALLTVRQDLDIPQDRLQWIASPYALTFA